MERESLGHKDAIVVLGKNVGLGWKAKEIEEQRFHLSPHSRISAIAAGMLYEQGVSGKIIISTGETIKGFSEAGLMKAQIQRIFPTIPDEAFILDEQSVQTVGNARNVKKIADDNGFKNLALVTVGFHMPRSHMLFEEAGLKVEDVKSEDVLAKKAPEFVKRYKSSKVYRGERLREEVAKLVQNRRSPIRKRLEKRIQAERKQIQDLVQDPQPQAPDVKKKR